MDNKTLVAQVAKKISRPAADVTALLEGFAAVLRERCGDLDSVAIPGFGSFVPVKEDEKIVTDLDTGRRVLLPPAITLTFQSSGRLRKTIMSR